MGAVIKLLHREIMEQLDATELRAEKEEAPIFRPPEHVLEAWME